MIIDYDYYIKEYKGEEVDDATFDKLNISSQAVVEYLTNKLESSLVELPSDILEKVKKAICCEIEYLIQNGGIKALAGNDAGQYQSESYSSYSYNKGTKQTDTIQYICGVPVAPMLQIHLGNTGLLYKGVKYVI